MIGKHVSFDNIFLFYYCFRIEALLKFKLFIEKEIIFINEDTFLRSMN